MNDLASATHFSESMAELLDAFKYSLFYFLYTCLREEGIERLSGQAVVVVQVGDCCHVWSLLVPKSGAVDKVSHRPSNPVPSADRG